MKPNSASRVVASAKCLVVIDGSALRVLLTVNTQGHFTFKATKVGSDTMLAQIIKMVEEAQGSQAPIQGLADKISAVFVPVVLAIAVVSFFAWLFVGTSFLGFSTALSYGFICFVGILVIACPCALGLATPTAIIVGVGKGAENGILIKDAESLEKLREVNTVVMDKTGTITYGKPQVTDIIVTDNTLKEEDILQLAGSVEHKSEHPLAQAIVDAAKHRKIDFLEVTNFKAIEGVGVEGTIKDKHITILKPAKSDITDDVSRLQSQGKTVVVITVQKSVIGMIAISDTIKEQAVAAIDNLHTLGVKVIMLTGDNAKTAQYIAKQVHIDDVIAEVLPQDKANKIKELQKEGNKVAMAGDGINDAPALTQADVGLAMATGTDVAIESADVVLLHGDIKKIAQAIRLSRATVSTIKQNLFWAFIYNIVGIPLAAGLMYPLFGILLNPIFAGLAMAGSSVSVVLNSLRLRGLRLNKN
jgi:Cu2+-exporting ATPase/Cu+-exporting ATPase